MSKLIKCRVPIKRLKDFEIKEKCGKATKRGVTKNNNEEILTNSEISNETDINIIAKVKYTPHEGLEKSENIKREQENDKLNIKYYDKWNTKYLTYVFLMFIIVLFLMLPFQQKISTTKYLFKNFSIKYKDQTPELWNALELGIENLSKDHSSVFLFLHTGDRLSNKLVASISETVAKHLGQHFFAVKASDLISKEALNDYGVIIDKLKKEFNEGGVLTITDLEQLPSQAAKSLHFICDTINPAIKKMLIFLTLTTKHKSGSPAKQAEIILNDLWKNSLENDVRPPLIARITDQVFWLN